MADIGDDQVSKLMDHCLLNEGLLFTKFLLFGLMRENYLIVTNQIAII